MWRTCAFVNGAKPVACTFERDRKGRDIGLLSNKKPVDCSRRCTHRKACASGDARADAAGARAGAQGWATPQYRCGIQKPGRQSCLTLQSAKARLGEG